MSDDIRFGEMSQHIVQPPIIKIVFKKSSFKILFKSLRCEWVNPSIDLTNGLVPSGKQAIT